MFGRLRVILKFCLTISYEMLYSEVEVFTHQRFQCFLVQEIHRHCSEVLGWRLFYIDPKLQFTAYNYDNDEYELELY
jgi:hypothetical protein